MLGTLEFAQHCISWSIFVQTLAVVYVGTNLTFALGMGDVEMPPLWTVAKQFCCCLHCAKTRSIVQAQIDVHLFLNSKCLALETCSCWWKPEQTLLPCACLAESLHSLNPVIEVSILSANLISMHIYLQSEWHKWDQHIVQMLHSMNAGPWFRVARPLWNNTYFQLFLAILMHFVTSLWTILWQIVWQSRCTCLSLLF